MWFIVLVVDYLVKLVMKMNFIWFFNDFDENLGGDFFENDRNYGGVNYRIFICII